MIKLNRLDECLGDFGDQMSMTHQSPRWHGEGDVYTHTMMTLRALRAMSEFQSLPEIEQQIVFRAAMLHDIGKIRTTHLESGEWVAPHHAPIGSRMAREMLWKDFGMCGSEELMQTREAICSLIRYHSFPAHAIDVEDARRRLHKIASHGLLAPYFSIKLLCILARADFLGRICDDKRKMLDQITLCEELAREEGCYESCYPFPDMHTRRVYLSGAEVWKEQLLYDDTWGEVILMSGLPGTGKDTWIAKHLPGMPMISLDEIRCANKISPTEEQGYVANLAREQAKEYLRRHQPFVWNATNLTSQMRESLVSLMETYHAHVRIVYLETDWDTLLQRNLNRAYPVPQSAIEKMLAKLTPPAPYEAETVEWINL